MDFYSFCSDVYYSCFVLLFLFLYFSFIIFLREFRLDSFGYYYCYKRVIPFLIIALICFLAVVISRFYPHLLMPVYDFNNYITDIFTYPS